VKQGRVVMNSAIFNMRFFSILAKEASKSVLSSVAKSVKSKHLIVAARGFYIINASSPKDFPASSMAASLMPCWLVPPPILCAMGTAVKSWV
jgi:hypothetical protein